jgi:PA domain
MKTRNIMAGAALLLLAAAPYTMAANGPVVEGNFTINVLDPDPSIGFSDTTPAAPIDGNPGRTVGAQRLEAYKHVVRIWDEVLDINTQIVLRASFAALSCTATGGTLGSAGTISVFTNFPAPSFPNTWYSGALANNLVGEDLTPGEPDPSTSTPAPNDEIRTFFNANLGKPGCLENTAWYYGFTNNPPPGAIDFIAVLTHEVGHGLGFQNFASVGNGSLFLGLPDQWTRFLGDNLIGKRWDQMIDFERLFSIGNGPNLVWNGPGVTAETANVLGPARVILVTAPSEVDGTELPFGTASFGPALPPEGIQGTLALANDGTGVASDACEPLVGFPAGRIALIDRGLCTFVVKTLNAEDAGASAVIIADNAAGATPPGLGGTEPVGITAVSVTQDGGQLLRAFPDTSVDIGAPASDGSLAGTDSAGRMQMYAPAVIAPGSSVSHYNTSAFPNVLMEPFNTNVDVNDGDVDLTDELLRDIGWDGNVSCPINGDDRPTVIVDGCDSGVDNRKGEYAVVPGKFLLGAPPGAFGGVAGGCFINDVIAACESPFVPNPNNGQYQSCIAQLTDDMVRAGIISTSESTAIRVCAAAE